MNGQPKPAFYVAVAVIVIALIAFAIYRSDIFAPAPKAKSTAPIAKEELGGDGKRQAEEAGGTQAAKVELMAKEYEFVPREKLIPAQGVSRYTPLDQTDNTVKFAINVWAGWGPIILANDGFAPKKVWKTQSGREFKVSLELIDNPTAMRSAYETGQLHIGWATLDMMPLFMESFVQADGTPRDTRIMPRIFQQIDWSNGGDGIVVREKIKSINDLKGKRVVLAQNSPSHYFLLYMLVSAGLQPNQVKMDFTRDAFQAAAAYNAQKDIDGCVSWAPDIYNLEKVKGNKLLVTTAQANRLIADIWFARADFARDNPDICEALVRGIFDAMREVREEEPKKEEERSRTRKMAELMAKGYNMPADDALKMLGDAHSTNWAENYDFFLNQRNPTNFETIWNRAYRLYAHPQLGIVTHKPVPFDQVMDFSIVKRLGDEPKYYREREEVVQKLAPLPPDRKLEAEDPILGNRFYLRFDSNNSDPYHKVVRDPKKGPELYDPNVDSVIEQIGTLAGTLSGARIVIEGHTDSSRKSQVPLSDLPDLYEANKQLSQERADGVRKAILEKYPSLNPNQLIARGKAWDVPADPKDPMNHTLNRRVEVKVYPAE